MTVDNLTPLGHHKLTLAMLERVAVLSGECGEVIHALGKIQRHGFESRNPLDSHSPTNRQSLETEAGHLLAALELMIQTGDLSPIAIQEAKDFKLATIGDWLHHQG